MAKATLRDIAELAGVGTATVERVLNGRGGVRAEKIERILVAAKTLGYGQRILSKHRSVVRIEVILVRPETNFYKRTNIAFERIAASLDKSVVLHRTFARENSPADFAHYVAHPKFRRSALIVVTPSHPDIMSNVRSVAKSGIPVIQIMAHPAHELPYVGIDNYSAGRTAGYYMSLLTAKRSGSIIAHCHGSTYENHRERIRGFSDYLLENNDDECRFTEVAFNLDDENLAMELLIDSLERDQQISGLYTAGGDNVAVSKVLRKYASRRIHWIGHELTDHTRACLKEGVMSFVLDQSPEVQARRAIDLIMKELGLIEVEVSTDPVRFLTITPENI